VIPIWIAHDNDASIGDSGIKSNVNVMVSKGKLSDMCLSCKRRKLYSNNGDDCIGVDVINVNG
jgi:hypothetical protein